MLTETSNKIINITENILQGIYHTPVTKFQPNTYKMFSMLFNRIAYANEMWKHGNLNILNEVIKLNIPKTKHIYF